MAKQTFNRQPIRVGMLWAGVTFRRVGAFPAGWAGISKARWPTSGAAIADFTVTRIDNDTISLTMTASEAAKLSTLPFETCDGEAAAWVRFDILQTAPSSIPLDIKGRVRVIQSASA